MIEIWVGTRKGAFVFRSKGREQWTSEGPVLVGEEVNHVVQDPRRPNRYYAAAGTAWFGPHLRVSEDAGKPWQPSEEGLSLESVEKSVKAHLAHPPGSRRRARRTLRRRRPGCPVQERRRWQDLADRRWADQALHPRPVARRRRRHDGAFD